MATKKVLKFSVDQLSPTPGYVVVEPAASEQQTSSGIYLPDSHEDKPQYGTVISVGGDTYEDGQKITAPAKKGDIVVYKKWGGNEVKFGVNDVEYQILQFKDVLGVFKTK